MEKDKELEYSCENNEESIIKEEALAYGVKQQGDYTLEDYYAWPEEQRIELIDGVIYDMAAPTFVHQRMAGRIHSILDTYILKKKGKCIPIMSPIDVQLDCDDKTMVQPDVVVICDRDKVINRCIYGAPDFIVEIISPSSAKKDTVKKLKKYKDAGVREYWIVDSDKKKVVVYDWSRSDIPVVYGFDAKVPVSIFGGDCEVDFAEIYAELAFLYKEEI